MHKPLAATADMDTAADAFADVARRAALKAMQGGLVAPRDLAERVKGLPVEARLQNILIGVAPASRKPTKPKSLY